MKPLTIEELKSLEVGDWVWVVDILYQVSFYQRVAQEICIECSKWTQLTLDNYGNEWLAYKNKEAAEVEEYKINFDDRGGWEVCKYIPAHYQPWFTADSKEEAERRLAELRGE